jgi:hypothetical protein
MHLTGNNQPAWLELGPLFLLQAACHPDRKAGHAKAMNHQVCLSRQFDAMRNP